MKTYEAMCVFLPETEVKEKGIDFVRETLKSHGAIVEKEENMGIQTLAYPIRDYTQANYFYFMISLEPEKVVSVSSELKPRSELLRFLLIKK